MTKKNVMSCIVCSTCINILSFELSISKWKKIISGLNPIGSPYTRDPLPGTPFYPLFLRFLLSLLLLLSCDPTLSSLLSSSSRRFLLLLRRRRPGSSPLGTPTAAAATSLGFSRSKGRFKHSSLYETWISNAYWNLELLMIMIVTRFLDSIVGNNQFQSILCSIDHNRMIVT